jgi:cytochrome c553
MTLPASSWPTPRRSALALVVAVAIAASLPRPADGAADAGVATAETRVAGAAPPDPLARRLAACTACHGPQGRATADGYYPRIAGKPAGYLYNQLLAFREGRRAVPSMIWMVDPLPDPYLREIAAHFAAQHPPHPPPVAPAAPASVLERGRRIVAEGDPGRGIPACVACHGQAMLGTEPAIPGLLGLPRDYLNAQLGAWREGLRRAVAPDCMATIARRLAAEDVAALTAWLAAQPVPADARASAPVSARLPLDCGGLAP